MDVATMREAIDLAYAAQKTWAAIPFLPAGAELNTVVHLTGDTSRGKTTTLQTGASVWGKGR
jgi:hypothetical protein